MASWDDPTGEIPVVHTGRTEQITTAERAPAAARRGTDRAIARSFIAVLVVALAVGAFIFGRTKVDNANTTSPSVVPSNPVVLPDSTTTTTVHRGSTTTSTTVAPAPSDPIVTVPTVPITSPPSTTSTTTPPTTATTAPPAPTDANP